MASEAHREHTDGEDGVEEAGVDPRPLGVPLAADVQQDDGDQGVEECKYEADALGAGAHQADDPAAHVEVHRRLPDRELLVWDIPGQQHLAPH